MRILHISDLHFPTRLSWTSLRGKSLVGYANYSLRRRKMYPAELYESLVQRIKSTSYDVLIISGDITNVSNQLEFEIAKAKLKPILDERTFIIPGNHDRYNLQALYPRDLFEEAFSEFMGESIPFADETGMPMYLRQKKMDEILIIGWDSNKPLPISRASGYVPPVVFAKTKEVTKSKKYILVCHHPLWNPSNAIESKGHQMQNRKEVGLFLKDHPPLAYFHGHTHSNWYKTAGSELPFPIFNSASSTRLSDRKHICGFYSVELVDKGVISAERFTYDPGSKGWSTGDPLCYQESQGIV